MIRFLAALAALAVIAAATHANVLHIGGYGSPDAPLVMTVAALLAIGTAFCTTAWRDGHKLGAFVLTLCLIGGEFYWLGTNADREFTARATAIQPVKDAKTKHDAMTVRVEIARQTLTDANSELVRQAPLPGCRKECAALLKLNVANAQNGVEEALRGLDAAPAPDAPEHLAEHLNVAEWQWDALMAALRSAVVAAASIALGLALHPKRKPETTPVTLAAPVKLAVVAAAVPPTITPKRLPPPPRAPDAAAILAEFGTRHVKRDANGRVHMRDVLMAYENFCALEISRPLERETFVRDFADLCERAGLSVHVAGRDAYIVGARLVA